MSLRTVRAEGVAALLARARRDIDAGLLPSCQLALACRGEVVASETFGAPAGSRYLTFSVTKAMCAGLAWLLISEGEITDQTRVAEVIPEFAANGKAAVTVEHLLTHTAGFARAPMRPEEGADRVRRVQRMASWRLDYPPGTATEYHATSAYWALTELVERVSGRDHRELFAERIAKPLGLADLTLGAAPGERVQPVRLVGERAPGRGLGDQVAETGEQYLLRYNEPEVLAIGVPGAGAVGTAVDVAMFYQALLNPPPEVWDPAVVTDATTNVRNRMVDRLLGVPANRTLGLVVAGDDGKAAWRGFGRSTSPRAFGAMGVGGQVAWADPESGLSFCYLTNGLDVDVTVSFTRSAKLSGLAARTVSG